MTDKVINLLEKASRAVKAAEGLAAHGDLDFAASRAYYAMFYAVVALFAEKDLTFRKHAGIHAAFGEHFARTGVMDPKYHRWLLDAFDKRLKADYGFEVTLTAMEVSEMVKQAQEFVKAVRSRLEPR